MLKNFGNNAVFELLSKPSSADAFLKNMSTIAKIGEVGGLSYQKAQAAQSAAAALHKIAQDALKELKSLEAAAAAALDAATKAQEEAHQKREAIAAQQAEMRAMLVPLLQKRAATQADFEAGVRAREAERRRLAEEAKGGQRRPHAEPHSKPKQQAYLQESPPHRLL